MATTIDSTVDQRLNSEAAADGAGPIPGRARLVALCFLMLFLELALIRWTAANVLYMAYFSNFVLLGSFLGIGLGFLRAGASRRSLVAGAPIALAALIAGVWTFPVVVNRTSSDIVFFGLDPSGPPIWVTLPLLFAAIAGLMMLVGEAVARTFARFEPLEAYRLDIIGSLLGICAFTALSFLGLPPVVWGAVVAVLMIALVVVPPLRQAGSGTGRLVIAGVQVAALLVVLMVLGDQSMRPRTLWSPYYEVTWRTSVFTTQDKDRIQLDGLRVNGLPHQIIYPLDVLKQHAPIYSFPYEVRTARQLDEVLVVGAGNGNDVALALDAGARHVDAVEIDPVLQRLGKRRHPERPYDDPRVDVHITDGRAYMERTNRTYDVVIFALPDSLTLVGGQSSLRLESYLFTRESIALARAHLRPGGTFSMYNNYRSDWLVDRFAQTMANAFGHEPCVDQAVGNVAALSIGLTPGDTTCPSNATFEDQGTAEQPVSDDRPFPYLREASIPNLYIAALGLILLASLVAVGTVAGGPRGVARMRPYADLFFMGAAFLLLETKSIVQFALWFGTTWVVNAMVFAAILVSVLVAIEVARRWRPRHPWLLYGALLASLAVAWLVPSSALFELDLAWRFVAAGALAFTPIFLANLVFAERFRDVASPTSAFGANLLGAMVGGVLEYGALVTGYRSLIVATAVLYGLAFLLGRKHLARVPAAPAATIDVVATDGG